LHASQPKVCHAIIRENLSSEIPWRAKGALATSEIEKKKKK
jgi:hypothetical protein